jgi:hypothetical protein
VQRHLGGQWLEETLGLTTVFVVSGKSRVDFRPSSGSSGVLTVANR